MGAGALQMSTDMSFEVVQRVTGQGSYAFESICRGTNTGSIGPLPGTGGPFTFRGVSIGELSDAGLIVSQRDYWDLCWAPRATPRLDLRTAAPPHIPASSSEVCGSSKSIRGTSTSPANWGSLMTPLCGQLHGASVTSASVIDRETDRGT